MSVGINYRRNISVGNSVAFLRFSGSDKPITRGGKLNNNKKYIQRAVKMIREKLSIARRKDSKEEISPAFSSLFFFFMQVERIVDRDKGSISYAINYK
jgi:hypothetical protein